MNTNAASPPGGSRSFSWAVAIFAARENPQQLMQTVDAVRRAAVQDTVIDLLINGNHGLATEMSSLLQTGGAADGSAIVRVWSIRLGDKAHAFNQYVHDICPRARVSFFVDGYVQVENDALRLLDEGMSSHPRSLAGTGVPSTGRNAQAMRDLMLREGGIQGNLFALKEEAMSALKERGFKLPLGIYRTDPTLGAALAFGLDPAVHAWDLKGRIFVHPDVTWKTDDRKWWRISELKSQYKRKLRQAQGVLENRAVHQHMALLKKPPEALPRTASEMVLNWMDAYPSEARAVLRKEPLCRIALKKLCEPRDWSTAEQAPELMTAGLPRP